MNHVKLLLMADVPDLGKRGQQVKVKPGYARNLLFPQNLAVPATKNNLAMVEKRRVRWLAEEAKLIEELKEFAGHIAKLDLLITGKAQETGHLYGSITAKDIAAAAKNRGVTVDPKHIRLQQPLKSIGDYEVVVRLHEQVQVTIPVHVRMEGREEWLPEKGKPEAQAAQATPAKPTSPEPLS
jgi:large subunit ribosomal protein L9